FRPWRNRSSSQDLDHFAWDLTGKILRSPLAKTSTREVVSSGSTATTVGLLMFASLQRINEKHWMPSHGRFPVGHSFVTVAFKPCLEETSL
ncbi:MAG: hypothetical protein H7835_20385, partial [Magnetococcus sp. XQGC-1]